MIETYCYRKGIPSEKLEDITLNHYHRVQNQREIKQKIEQEVKLKEGQTKKGKRKRKKQLEATEKEIEQYQDEFRLIFSEVPFPRKTNKMLNVGEIIPYDCLNLWKKQREYRISEMRKNIPNEFNRQRIFAKVKFFFITFCLLC